MLQSRRGFLIGAGSLLAAAFVKEASAFVRSTGLPLLVTPSEPTYWLFWDDFYRQFKASEDPNPDLRGFGRLRRLF